MKSEKIYSGFEKNTRRRDCRMGRICPAGGRAFLSWRGGGQSAPAAGGSLRAYRPAHKSGQSLLTGTARRQSRRRHRHPAGLGFGAKRPGRRRQSACVPTSSQTESEIRTGSPHGLLRECAKRPRPGRGAPPPVCNIDSSHFNKGSRLRSIMVGRNCNAADPLTAPRRSPRRSHRAKHRNFVADFCAGALPGLA